MKKNIRAVPVPCDVPYEYWEPKRSMGKLFYRCGMRQNLPGWDFWAKYVLINEKYGNMVYIGAVLMDIDVEADKPVTGHECPAECNICIKSCPPGALDGVTVNQALYRGFSIGKTGRGFDVLYCNRCRKNCPKRFGY